MGEVTSVKIVPKPQIVGSINSSVSIPPSESQHPLKSAGNALPSEQIFTTPEEDLEIDRIRPQQPLFLRDSVRLTVKELEGRVIGELEAGEGMKTRELYNEVRKLIAGNKAGLRLAYHGKLIPSNDEKIGDWGIREDGVVLCL